MNEYDDIIHLDRPQSNNRKHMSNLDRAAQFSPFAALTGYDGMVKESARLTDQELELTEQKKEELNLKLSILQEQIHSHPQATITYFVPDQQKEGGAYQTKEFHIFKIDAFSQTIQTDTETIPIKYIIEIEIPGGLYEFI